MSCDGGSTVTAEDFTVGRPQQRVEGATATSQLEASRLVELSALPTRRVLTTLDLLAEQEDVERKAVLIVWRSERDLNCTYTLNHSLLLFR